MARFLEAVGKELDKAVAAIDKAMDDPAIKKGEQRAAEVVDRTMAKVDAILARAYENARANLGEARGPVKKSEAEVSEDLRKAREEVQRKRGTLKGHRIEDTAAKVLDDVGRTVDRVANRVKEELNRP